jgi:hypothetical protein
MPNPPEPGNIAGQIAATPERLPDCTDVGRAAPRRVGRKRRKAERPAVLFGAGELAAVMLVSSGVNLSEPPPGTDWVTERSFTCGTCDQGPPEVTQSRLCVAS